MLNPITEKAKVERTYKRTESFLLLSRDHQNHIGTKKNLEDIPSKKKDKEECV